MTRLCGFERRYGRISTAPLVMPVHEPEVVEKRVGRERERDEFEFVYFIGDPEGDTVKIGRTYSPRKRLLDIRSVQPSHPKRIKIRALLVCVGIGSSHDAEREMHELLSDARLHGEWFKRTSEVEREIAGWAFLWNHLDRSDWPLSARRRCNFSYAEIESFVPMRRWFSYAA